jgi:hypothetical protein
MIIITFSNIFILNSHCFQKFDKEGATVV